MGPLLVGATDAFSFVHCSGAAVCAASAAVVRPQAVPCGNRLAVSCWREGYLSRRCFAVVAPCVLLSAYLFGGRTVIHCTPCSACAEWFEFVLPTHPPNSRCASAPPLCDQTQPGVTCGGALSAVCAWCARTVRTVQLFGRVAIVTGAGGQERGGSGRSTPAKHANHLEERLLDQAPPLFGGHLRSIVPQG